MGKPSKWFKALMLNKKYWCFVKCIKNDKKDQHHHTNAASSNGVPTTMTAASNVAEITRISGSHGARQVWAAIKIQSHFRAYLSRRALRALKSLVRLQALVRGQIVRKQTAYNIQRLHASLRVQAIAFAKRSHISQSLPFTNGSQSDGKNFNIHLEKYSHTLITSKQSSHQIAPNMSSVELKSLDHLNIFQHPEDGYYYTALEPTKIDCSRSSQCSFSEHPNYMACTESSRAKMRSLSAPKQRTPYERSSSSSATRGSINSLNVSELQAKFSSKLYPGSGRRLERLGVINRRR